MNTTINSDFQDRQDDASDDSRARRKLVGTIAGVAVAAAGAASVAAGLAIPSVLGGMNLGNHNETLLTDVRGGDG
jgi:hypothetical protein